MPTWDANLYLQFANERSQPAVDLIARINLAHPARIIDLGSGPGNSTALLRARWPAADITGLDNSPEMIAAAVKAYPAEKWVLADAATWAADSPFDLVFSNAALQWLPEHARLFPHLMAQVAPGGVLAVQMPAHYDSPFHQVLLEVSNAAEWRHLMASARTALTKELPSLYYNVLQPLASHLDIWVTEYYHILESPRSIVEWFRGTGMRPFLEALASPEQKQQFEQRVLEGCTRAYPPQNDGRVLLQFRRLFIMASR
jgi:trans-aconitate 2-methyltransferase